VCARPALDEGRIAIVTDVDAGCGGRGRHVDERAGSAFAKTLGGRVPQPPNGFAMGVSRTAKSCGSGTPTLVPSVRRSKQALARDGGKKARSPGRARISRKTIRAGKAGLFRPYLWFLPRAFLRTGAAGVADTRPSLRPLPVRRGMFSRARARIASRERWYMP